MSFAPLSSLGNYLELSVTLPEEPLELRNALVKILETHARMINRKDTGSYEVVEQLNSQLYFGPDPQTKRSVYRKCFSFGVILTNNTHTIAHGLSGVVEYTRIYGTAKMPAGAFWALPRVSTINVNRQVSLDIIGANINIVNGAGCPNISCGLVVLEFVKS